MNVRELPFDYFLLTPPARKLWWEAGRLRKRWRITKDEYDGILQMILSKSHDTLEVARLSLKHLRKTRKYGYTKFSLIENNIGETS